ncbi:hypothetical protein LSM04_008401 [Trypanosoma melophagium]|uniref:uncharacterized protein n=1 Tax=Trypanosoma melophagium TaxID=715481 RepID=UPI00351A4E66|nr:hypothetical protein LSM04_008401 [Trypanosoma melophagium]
MYQEELRDSIGQLEQDLRTADKNRTGFLPQNVFEMVLLRNGGSSEQAEALTEQFRIGGSDHIHYVELLESMRSLAGNTMTSPTQENSSGNGNSNSNTGDTRSVSPFSDENDAVNREVEYPSREQWCSPVIGTTTTTNSIQKGGLSNNNSQYNIMELNKGNKRRDDNFYTSLTSAPSHIASVSVPEESPIRRPFVLPHRRESAVEKSKNKQQEQQHEEKSRSYPHAAKDVKTSDFVKNAVDRVSSPVYRASSVEKMVQQAKLRALSESSTPKGSETSKKHLPLGNSSEKREQELFPLPNSERNNDRSVKRIQNIETPTSATKNVVSNVKATEDVVNSFSRGIRINDRMTQHNIFRVSHGTSTVGVFGRGELISLREVFRVIDQNRDGVITLREIWNALHRRGIEVHMPELEALADSLDLDESDMTDTIFDSGEDNSIDRVLSSVDFCMLVSRMRSSLIERIRRSSLWITGAPEPSPPPVPPVSAFIHKGAEITNKKRPHENAKGNNCQSGTLLSAACELTPSPRRQSSSPHTLYKSKMDVFSQDNMNSFSPPPSVHNSVTVTHLAESGITGTPQGRSTIVTADQQPLSGSTVFVSPSPEMKTSQQQQASPIRSLAMPPSSSRFSDLKKETNVILAKNVEQSSVVASRSESPHPYDVPIARGLQKETEFSVPPPYLHPVENRSGTQSMRILAGTFRPFSEKVNDGISGKTTISQDYAALHRELLARQKQRIEEEDFLRRLEMEFQERYSNLLNDTTPEPKHIQRFDVVDKMQTQHSDTSAQRVQAQRAIINHDTVKGDANEVASRSASSTRGSSPLHSNPRTVGRLFQHTASSLAHEREKKIRYIPPKRTTSLGRSSGSTNRKSNEKVSRGDVESIDSLQRRQRSFSTTEDSVSVSRQRCTPQREQPRQKESSPTTSVASTSSMYRSGSSKNVLRGSIRSVQPFSHSKGDVSTLSHHYRTNSMECKSALFGTRETNKSEPTVVRVSLVPDASPPTPTPPVNTKRIMRLSSAGTKSTSHDADLSAQRQRVPLPGMPPLPPNRSRMVEENDGEVDRVRHPQLSKSISEKLYGKCSRLLSLCSNYDRTQDGFLTPKDLGRALYAVAPDLTESEISDLVSMGLSQGKNGNQCHYVSLVGDLVVQESYVQLHEGSPESNGSNDDDNDNRNRMEDMVDGSIVISSEHPQRMVTPSSISGVSSVNPSPQQTEKGGERGGSEESLLEDRVKKGRLKMNRLVREELLKGCGGDYHLLRNAFFAHDDILTGYLEEKVLRDCLVRLFRTNQRLMPPWLLDRCVRLCRTPFEREMIAAAAHSKKGTTTLTTTTIAVAPPPDSIAEEAARRRVHGIPEVLWTVLCDYRYLLEELRL